MNQFSPAATANRIAASKLSIFFAVAIVPIKLKFAKIIYRRWATSAVRRNPAFSICFNANAPDAELEICLRSKIPIPKVLCK